MFEPRIAELLLSDGDSQQQRLEAFAALQELQNFAWPAVSQQQVRVGGADIEIIGTGSQPVPKPVLRGRVVSQTDGHLAQFGVAPGPLCVRHLARWNS